MRLFSLPCDLTHLFFLCLLVLLIVLVSLPLSVLLLLALDDVLLQLLYLRLLVLEERQHFAWQQSELRVTQAQHFLLSLGMLVTLHEIIDDSYVSRWCAVLLLPDALPHVCHGHLRFVIAFLLFLLGV